MSVSQQTKAPVTGGQMFRASAWMIALRWSVRLTGVVSTIFLARLLMPSDFGIVAMAMFFVGMLEILNQTGQKLAIIRQHEPTREHYDTAWTISIIMGLVIGAAVVAAAPLTLLYFHEPRAVPVMQWLALRAVIGGFENIGTVDFRRDLKFDRFFRYNMYPKLISFAVTLTLAYLWRNYWALVAGILTSQLAMNVMSYVMHPYRPRLSLAKLGDLWSFSGWTLFRTVGYYLNAQIDLFAVGGLFGASSMGRYTVAHDIAASPTQEVNDPMVAALYPVMATMQRDPVRLRRLYVRTLGWSAIICASASVGVTLVAHDMVQLVLGAKWGGVEPLMGWLALGAGLFGLSSGAYTTFDALGKPHLGARMQWVRLIFFAAALLCTSLIFRTMDAIAMTRVIAAAIFIPTLFYAAGSEIGVSARDYLHAIGRPFVATAFMALCVWPLNFVLPPGNVRLAIDVATGVLSFGGALLALWWLAGRPDSPEKDIYSVLARLLGRRAAVPETIHIISKFGNVTGGSEQRAIRLAQILGRHADVRLWSTHPPDPRLESDPPIVPIDPWRLRFPRSGTFVFVGGFLHIGAWIYLAQPGRRIVVLNTDSANELHGMMRRLCARPDGCEIVYSSEMLKDLIGIPGAVENSPIDVAKFSCSERNYSRRTPFVVGRMSRDYTYKFHEDDPALFRELAGQGFHLRLQGATCLAPELAGVSNVELLEAGAVPASDFLRSLDCLIYRTSSKWIETYGRVVIEAMASGLPVLCGPAGGYAKHIEHGVNGFLFADNAEAIEILTRLRSDPGLCATIGRNARRTVERIYSPSYEEALVKFYVLAPST